MRAPRRRLRLRELPPRRRNCDAGDVEPVPTGSASTHGPRPCHPDGGSFAQAALPLAAAGGAPCGCAAGLADRLSSNHAADMRAAICQPHANCSAVRPRSRLGVASGVAASGVMARDDELDESDALAPPPRTPCGSSGTLRRSARRRCTHAEGTISASRAPKHALNHGPRRASAALGRREGSSCSSHATN